MKRKNYQLEAVSLSQESLFKTSHLQPGQMLPLVIEPNITDLNLQAWAKNNLDFIELNLLKYGGILFRGFEIKNLTGFEEFVSSICPYMMRYMEAATPRTQLSKNIATSTEFPSNQSIALHNESSYVRILPMKIWFFAEKPADQGGETPIADVRKVFQHISQKTRERFIEKGWLLARNFNHGIGIPWQEAFYTTDKKEVEKYCYSSDIEFEWKDGDCLQTRQVRPSVVKHPKTGEIVWFNHIVFWHVSSLKSQLRETILTHFNEENIPYNTYYGDGSPIEPSVVDEIREAYRKETIIFPWHKGDILMLDNMLVAHGRNPFAGSRRVLVAMGQPYSFIGY